MSDHPFESEATALILTAESEDEALDRLAHWIRDTSGADVVDVFLEGPGDSLVMRASTLTPEYVHRCKLGRGVGICGQAFLSEEPIFFPSGAKLHDSNVAYPGVDDREHDALLAIPISIGDGKAFGVALLLHLGPWNLGSNERRQIEKRVDALGVAIALIHRGVRFASQADRLGAVHEVARSIGSSPYLEEILQLLVNMTAQQMGYTVCTVRLLDEQRGELVLRATQAPARAYRRKPAIKLGQSIAGRAISENRAIVVSDVLQDPDYIGHDLAAEQGLRSMACLPLTVQDRPLGVISCYTSETHDFDETELAALATIAKQAAYAIEHAKLQVRSTLMQEMHHRVKNNLQQVASLLRLQMRHGVYESLEEALEESLGRILAISAVHELLSREDLDHVGMRTLADSLIQIQRESLISPDKEIRFEVKGDDVQLNTTQATQMALILNELIQNAVLHGYRSAERGDVHINIEDVEGEIGVWVSNLGDPLPEGFKLGESSHLGLRIVENLTRSLGGRFVLEDRLGWTIAEVRFTRSAGE